MKAFFTLFFALTIMTVGAQDFLRTDHQEIVNNSGPVLLRSIGTGNWLLQEGYMLQSSEAGVNTHTQFRKKLEASMGKEKTAAFYDAWIANHFTKKDLDFMKASGFNAVRVALHYKWFTLPIEEESKNSDGVLNNTWLNKGFEIVDELLSWCEQNQMYLILDMHGTPGGQGKDANISDYNPNLPSLWESEDNKNKLEALWVKLANRYKNSEWIGGFDLINEPNWGFVDGENKNGCGCKNNDAIWNLQQRLIAAIRTVNKNHIVYISGNCWGNNYESFENHSLKEFDKNMALTFHKYWTHNTDASVQPWIDMRETYNLPLWMSEAGENSNPWFSDCISLFEKNNIGWSWWPVKKHRTNNILKITTGEKYANMLQTWKENKLLSEQDTYKAVMEYVESHKYSNCTPAKDVIYAMISQPGNTQTQPFKKHTTESTILFADYDLGNNGYAYFDSVAANYHISDGNDRAVWNSGKYYRNDGVDIGNNNGIPYVGWTEKGEWLNYTVSIPQEGNYSIYITYASEEKDGALTVELDDQEILPQVHLPKASNSSEVISKKVFLPQGEHTIKFKITTGGSDLFSFALKK